jgi:hypothetical protein
MVTQPCYDVPKIAMSYNIANILAKFKHAFVMLK